MARLTALSPLLLVALGGCASGDSHVERARMPAAAPPTSAPSASQGPGPAAETVLPSVPAQRPSDSGPSAAPAATEMPLLQAPSALATQIVLGYRGRTPIRVAVMRISVEEAEWKGMGDVLSEGLITQLFAKGNFNLVERAQVDQADKEIGQSKGAKFDSATVKRLGRAVSADAIIVGTLFRSGPGPIVNCRMLDVETGEILATAGPLLIRAESDSESQPGVSRSGTKKDTRTGAGGSMEAIGDGLRIRIVECTASGGSLAVVLSITSEGKDRQAVFASSSYFSLPQSRVILADGSQFRSTGVETGDGHTVSLVDGIPARAVLHFKGIPQSDSLPLLEVFIQVENVNATSYRFKSVPVSR